MKIKFSISIKMAFLIMVISLLGIGVVAYFSYYQANKIFIQHTDDMIAKNLDNYDNKITSNIKKLKYNIEILTLNPSMQGFFRAYMSKYKYDEKTNRIFSDYRNDISSIMVLMMKQNFSYYQVRVLDKDGNEILKLVKNDNGKIENIKKNKLQNKKHRKYFKEAMKTDDIFVSDITLNKEFNQIEIPFRPTVRVAKSVIINHKKVGMIVINSNIKTLFDFKSLQKRDIETYITNAEGYYIFHYKDPSKEYGFELDRNFKIFFDFPQLQEFYETGEKKYSYIGKNFILEARKIYIAKNKYLGILRVAHTSLFNQKAKTYVYNLMLFIILISSGIAIITTLLVKRLTKPIEELTKIAKKVAETKGNYSYNIDIQSNDEVGELAEAFKIMLDSLENSKKEVEILASQLEKEVDEKTKELKEVNKNLKHLVNEKVEEIRDKEKMLLQQSKMAAMGEMIGAIAHQWRQPLNSLALNIQLLEDLVEDNSFDEKTAEEFVEKNMQTIKFMSQTIDDFRNFFRKDKEKTNFNLKESIEKTINLQKAQLEDHNIIIEKDLKDMIIKGYKNEFMQVILNLISNSKDAIIEKREKEKSNFKGKIFIKNYQAENGDVIIQIQDNGGGISNELKDRIFEPYFTTKDEGKGTGIGLYMVKEIVERMDGKISFKNISNGVEFIIRFEGGGKALN